jgi:hypothetical protein
VKVVRLSASRAGRLCPQECSWYSFSLGAESTRGHGTVGRRYVTENPVTPPGIDPGTVRLVAQRLNHYAIPGPEADFICHEIVLFEGQLYSCLEAVTSLHLIQLTSSLKFTA